MVVGKGGEDIPNNTYGFEIEFCTHDNSVFAFTHVEVAHLRILFAGGQGTVTWKLETDSGNVLELVTSPLVFAKLEQANEYKAALSAALVASVGDGKTLGDWVKEVVYDDGPVYGVIRDYYSKTQNMGQISLRLDLARAGEIESQLNAMNVDDGINIQAGLLRFAQNKDYMRWSDYVLATIVSRSEKDWKERYSSQLNLPMTLPGYFEYALCRKLPRAWSRMADIYNWDDKVRKIATDKLERRVSTWFWSAAIFTAFLAYVDKSAPLVASMLDSVGGSRAEMFALVKAMAAQVEAGDLAIPKTDFDAIGRLLQDFAAVQPQAPTVNQVVELGLAYVKIHKVLTGALGSLSEAQQLALQEEAFRRGSTEVMVDDGIEDDGAELTDRRWLEYHSSMKDLTGLWFKGALEQVCLAVNSVGPPIPTKMYGKVLGFYISLMQIRRWEEGRVYVDDVSQIRLPPLADAIDGVIGELNKLTLDRCTRPPLPPRAFLDYAHAPPWEGRYDTMIDMIEKFGVGWTFLIEHRFH